MNGRYYYHKDDEVLILNIFKLGSQIKITEVKAMTYDEFNISQKYWIIRNIFLFFAGWEIKIIDEHLEKLTMGVFQ